MKKTLGVAKYNQIHLDRQAVQLTRKVPRSQKLFLAAHKTRSVTQSQPEPRRRSKELRRAFERPALLTQRARGLTQGIPALTQTHLG